MTRDAGEVVFGALRELNEASVALAEARKYHGQLDCSIAEGDLQESTFLASGVGFYDTTVWLLKRQLIEARYRLECGRLIMEGA